METYTQSDLSNDLKTIRGLEETAETLYQEGADEKAAKLYEGLDILYGRVEKFYREARIISQAKANCLRACMAPPAPYKSSHVDYTSSLRTIA